MEVIEKIISHKRPDVFNIYPLGDIHAGSIHCAENEIKRQVQGIANESNSYWLGMGDYADSILKDDPRFDICGLASWVKKDNIVECQRQWLRELFKPISKKCLALLTGNHEDQLHNRYQNDISRNLCDDLAVPYGGYASFINLKFKRGQEGSRQFLIHAWHGAGAAQTEGAQVMRLMRLVNEIQADIYLMGHLHTITVYTPDRLMYRAGKVKSIKLIAAITGSWLTGYTQSKQGQQLNPSYIERKGYKPTRIGCPVIKIDPDDNKFWIEV